MTEAELQETVISAAKELATQLQGTPDEPQVFAAIEQCLAKLAATQVWGNENRLPSALLWHHAGERLEHGQLLHRARFKPRGYAGDDTMLRQICEYWRCDHPLGATLDAHFQSHAAPQAVRNRTRMVAEAISLAVRQSTNSEVRVASVGSGPALDIAWAAEALSVDERAALRVTLLDLDPRALYESRERLNTWLAPDQVRAARENLYRLPQRPTAGELLDADVISCTGFFDYLNEADASALLAQFWKSLRPGGRLLVFNFAPQNASRALMEWIGNWYLVYRDEAEMFALAEAAEIPRGSLSIGFEPAAAALYIDARKN